MASRFGRRLAPAIVGAACLAPLAATAADTLPEVTVTGTREGELRSETPTSVSVIGKEKIDGIKPTHPMEIINRAPGAAVVPTTGEGHTTAIRQPMTTDAVYQFLEDGVPIRATGFFNHNALYEINIPQADSIEVVRGPGSALQGSDAIGGVVNVMTRPPSLKPEARTTAEVGSYGWARFLGSASNTWGDTGLRGDLNLTYWDGWRDATKYHRESTTLRWDELFSSGLTVKTVLSGTNIDQDTGANSRLSLADYQNNPTRNYTPIAFRKVDALRLSQAYEYEDGKDLTSVTPYVRWNKMELLPSWQLTYDPVQYETGHSSLGVLARHRHDFDFWRSRLIGGIDLDYSPGYREEWALSTTRSNNVFTSYRRNTKLYDYDVVFTQASPYLHAETSPIDRLRLSAGVRFDYIGYDYTNKLTTLQTGTWRRPESGNVDYTHLSPSLGATFEVLPTLNVFANYKQAFRAPSESQLFRQGRNINSIGIDPVVAESVEAGVRRPETDGLSWEVAAYRMIKRNDILTARDGAGQTTTNSGQTLHQGIEASVGYTILPGLRAETAWSAARHEYQTWRANGGDFHGKDMPLAPRVLGNTVLSYAPPALPGARLEGEWTHMSDYQLDDANTKDYDGHHLFTLRAAYDVTPNLSAFFRVFNVTDASWATTGAVTNGLPEFAPGQPRTFYGGITARF